MISDDQIRKLRAIAASHDLSGIILTTMWALGEMPRSRFINPDLQKSGDQRARKTCEEIITLLQRTAPQLKL